MEHTVGQISRLLTEFVTILQTQRSSVDDVRCCLDTCCWLYVIFTTIITLPSLLSH